MGQWVPAERVRMTEISREVRAEKEFKKMLKDKDLKYNSIQKIQSSSQ